MRLLKQPKELQGVRLAKLGVRGTIAYLQCNKPNGIEVWSVDTLVPGSYTLLFFIPLHELYYNHATYCYARQRIFVFSVALQEQGEEGMSVVLYEMDPQSRQMKRYYLDPSAVDEFFSIPLHNASIGVGQENMFIYDRSIIKGTIPYWYINISEEDTFTFTRNDIPGMDGLESSRFPLEFNGESRKFGRLSDDHRLLIFMETEEKWVEYYPHTNNHIHLGDVTGRGLRETFSRSGHRAMAIESPFSFFIDGEVAMLRHVHDGQHSFYRLILDDDNRQYRLIRHSSLVLRPNLSVGRMSYTMVHENLAFIVGSSEVATAFLQPPSLAHLALWAFQKYCSKVDGDGAYSDGRSVQDIYQLVGFNFTPNIA